MGKSVRCCVALKCFPEKYETVQKFVWRLKLLIRLFVVVAVVFFNVNLILCISQLEY